MIILINGPCGIGKTTISELIAQDLDNCCLIHGDDIHNSIVNSQIIPKHLQVTDANIDSMVHNFKEYGFENIIIDYVYEDVISFKEIVKKFEAYDQFVVPILLRCGLDENIRRDKLRKKEDVMGAERIRELYEVFQNFGSQLGYNIDVTDLSKEEVSMEVKNIINNLSI